MLELSRRVCLHESLTLQTQMTSTKTSGCSILIFIVIAHAKGSHITTMFCILLRITNRVHYVLFAPTPKPMNCYLQRAVYKNAILHSTALILKRMTWGNSSVKTIANTHHSTFTACVWCTAIMHQFVNVYLHLKNTIHTALNHQLS